MTVRNPYYISFGRIPTQYISRSAIIDSILDVLLSDVVDMFYFPLIDTFWPEWVPFVGGNHLLFFNAIFNVADAAITIGVILLIIDQLFLAKNDEKLFISAEKSAENDGKEEE